MFTDQFISVHLNALFLTLGLDRRIVHYAYQQPHSGILIRLFRPQMFDVFDAVTQFLEQFAKLCHLVLTDQRGVTGLDVFTYFRAGLDQQAPLACEADDLGPSVTRIGDAFHIAQAFDLIDQLPHRLLGHRRARSEFRQPCSFETEERDYRLVGRLQVAMAFSGKLSQCRTLEVFRDVEQRLADVRAPVVIDVVLREFAFLLH